MDVHLRDLRALLAVAEERSVTRAAQRLFLAQPALSKQLRALGRQLGVPLLERLPRGVALTEAGRALLEPARDAVQAWDRGLAAVRAVATAASVVIGMQTAVGRDLQRRSLARFRELAPGVVPSLRLVGWQDPTAGLADASSDVAFVWLPVPLDDVDLLPVATEQRWVALPDGHRLAGSATVAFSDLLDEPFVALPDAAGPLRDHWPGGRGPREQGSRRRSGRRDRRRGVRSRGVRARHRARRRGQRAAVRPARDGVPPRRRTRPGGARPRVAPLGPSAGRRGVRPRGGRAALSRVRRGRPTRSGRLSDEPRAAGPDGCARVDR